ncbi:sugar phosphate isomerase [Paenibacillus sp. CCS19]|uniref:sugar phosphate isomerase/epimerase family protein n=1 Tax=Paenibacillus sp. CCS19 TaxID=3158387 RepID=UPI00255EB678|nr:sugar phosphate isomerase/epimerase [Paenibacillus cellulosilyticus]GMK39262.1 sugar phosphate isomerase [Paenibacillus cellulosilyticus]
MGKPLIGIQLYTLRDLTETDLLGTIRKVAELGYEAVEFAGFFGHSAAEVSKVLDETGLKAPSAHVPLQWSEPEDKMWAAYEEALVYAKEIGLTYVVVPWAPMPEVPTIEDVNKLIAVLKRASNLAREAGFIFGYHNHDFELKQVDGLSIMDHMLTQLSSEELIAEFDLGWVHMGGAVPVDYINRYAGRVPLAHFKDFGDGTKDTEIGRGVVDFEPVLAVAEQAGIEYFIVEQEQFQVSSLESAKICLEFFRQRGY